MGEMLEYSEKLPHDIGLLLINKKLTLALAESCSGGLVSHRITQVPGSSNYFLGGVVAYSNDMKMRLLGVHESTLDQYGAVSKQTAIEMAQGIKKISDASICCAITGIAGPGGGSIEKPLGLVYIAVTSYKQEECKQFQFLGSREEIKIKTSNEALKMILYSIEHYG
ncbi:MAG: CinA family protein [Candidatus Auribacterota bacterium]|jgi:PncC family amidohydrolase|nr:CinA family protein [Candidatus Auribacterota bacterium]